MTRLRPYQAECVRAVLESIGSGGRRALLHLATGTGKTLIAAKLVQRLMRAGGVKALFLVDRIQLAVQARETFESVLPGRSYVLRPGRPRREKDVTIVLLQTMISRLHEFEEDEFDVVFVDECHRSVYGRWRPCVERFDAVRIGLTATPSDREGRDTHELFGPATYKYLLVRGIREGYLAPYRVYRAMTRITRDGVCTDAWCYGPQELERRVTVPDRNRKMAEEVERIAVAGKTLVYAKTKRHAAELARCFNALRPSLGGRYAEAITTDSADPQAAIRRFKREDLPRIAVSVGMLDTGFDCPEVANIVLCRATKSEILYKQIRGRGTRLCEGKNSFLMLDLAGNGEWFDEGHSCAGCETVTGENGHGPIEKEGVLIVSAVDEWISRAWFVVTPGMEAVDERDLAGMSAAGLWLLRAEMEVG